MSKGKSWMHAAAAVAFAVSTVACATPVAADEAPAAEYAIRWNPRQGGPGTAQAAAARLGLEGSNPQGHRGAL